MRNKECKPIQKKIALIKELQYCNRTLLRPPLLILGPLNLLNWPWQPWPVAVAVAVAVGLLITNHNYFSVCACGQWVCTSNICSQGFRDVEENFLEDDKDSDEEGNPEDDPHVQNMQWF